MSEQLSNRKIIKQIGLISSLPILGLWLTSAMWTFGYLQYGARPASFNFRAGLFQIYTMTSTIPAKWLTSIPRGWQCRRLQWAPDATLNYQLGLSLPGFERFKTGTVLTVPLWLPFIIALTPPLALWYAERIRHRHRLRKIHAPCCARPLRLILSLTSFSLLVIAQSRIVGDIGPWSLPTIAVGLIFGTILFTAYLGARLLYVRLGWRREIALSTDCTSCGYNLTGNTSGTCPECGTAIRPDSGRRNVATSGS